MTAGRPPPCHTVGFSNHTENKDSKRMNLLGKIKGLVGGNKKAVAGAIDKVADVVESKTSDDMDKKVEAAAEKAKDFVEGLDTDDKK